MDRAGLLGDTMRGLGLLGRLKLSDHWFEGFDGRYDHAARALPISGALLVLPGALVLLAAEAVGLASMLAALLGVSVTLLVTGALHEDGLADCADALGARARDRMLSIMRDSTVGTFGALALFLAISARVLALSELGGLLALAAWIAAAAGARAAMVWVWGRGEAARSEGAAVGAGQPTAAALRTAVVATFVLLFPALILLGPLRMLAALALLAAVVVGVRRSVMARIGGYTGDTLGAVAALGETAILVGLATG